MAKEDKQNRTDDDKQMGRTTIPLLFEVEE
jgi:hypothetical protein